MFDLAIYAGIVSVFGILVWFIFRSGEKRAELKSANNKLDTLLKVKKWRDDDELKKETIKKYTRNDE